MASQPPFFVGIPSMTATTDIVKAKWDIFGNGFVTVRAGAPDHPLIANVESLGVGAIPDSNLLKRLSRF